jgi:excisionase family DNA binding protein
MPANETTTPTPWLTPREAAARARVGVGAVYAAVQRGRLKAVRLGVRRDIRIHESWVDAWLNAAVIVNPDAPGDDVPLTFNRRRKARN